MTKVTELTRIMSSLSPDRVEDGTEFVSFFPDFAWAIKDFILELKLDGCPIREDEYLKNTLKMIPGIRSWTGYKITW